MFSLDLFSDETDQVWVWEYGSGPDKADLFMDIGEEIRRDIFFLDIKSSVQKKRFELLILCMF